MSKYKYTSYSQMPPYMKAYILSCSNKSNLEDIPIQRINRFLNSEEEWKSDPLYGKNYSQGRY
jgi:hypothetical protein